MPVHSKVAFSATDPVVAKAPSNVHTMSLPGMMALIRSAACWQLASRRRKKTSVSFTAEHVNGVVSINSSVCCAHVVRMSMM